MAVADHDLRQEVLEHFSTERLYGELKRRGFKMPAASAVSTPDLLKQFFNSLDEALSKDRANPWTGIKVANCQDRGIAWGRVHELRRQLLGDPAAAQSAALLPLMPEVLAALRNPGPNISLVADVEKALQPTADTTPTIEDRAHQLVWDAAQAGMLVRIDLVPRKPLAMGNLQMVVDVRPAQPRQTQATAQPENTAQPEYTAEEEEAWRALERKADRCLQPGDPRTKGD